jgi:hypothetical protein
VCTPDVKIQVTSTAGEAPVPVGMREALTTKNEGINDDDKDPESKV